MTKLLFLLLLCAIPAWPQAGGYSSPAQGGGGTNFGASTVIVNGGAGGLSGTSGFGTTANRRYFVTANDTETAALFVNSGDGAKITDPYRTPDTGAAEERAAAAQAGRNDRDGDGCKPQLTARNDGVETPLLPAKEHPRPRSHRQLGNAIFAAADPVKAGRELLEPGEERADPTRLRSLATFADWAYGERGEEGYRKPPRIIWDIPGPPYEPADPEQEKLEGGEK